MQKPNSYEFLTQKDLADLCSLFKLFHLGVIQSKEVQGALELFHATIRNTIHIGNYDSVKLVSEVSNEIREFAFSLGIDLESSLEEFNKFLKQLNNFKIQKANPIKTT